MSLTQLLLTSFLVAFTGALAPGPITAITMRYGVILGPSAGLAVSVGHGLVELAMLWALVLGLGKLLILPQATSVIASLGSLVLAWMAWGALMEARRGNAGWATVDSSTGTPAPRIAGFKTLLPVAAAAVAATITNPYWMLWWATIGANYVLLAQAQGVIGLGTFFTGHISADIFTFILFAAMASTGERLLGQKFYRGLMLVLAVFLAVLAFYFARLALA